jgi:hypothetical protein
MDIARTDEEAARHILWLFTNKFGARRGSILLPHFFNAEFAIAPWTAADLRRGCEYSVERGWIEINEYGSLKLTEAGANEPA